MIAYKLLRRRKDGSFGPLFINTKQRIPLNQWLQAECHPTKGYAIRPGWHCTSVPVAPHLSTKGRVWCRIEIEGVRKFERPECQGGTWLLAERMRVLEVLTTERKEEHGTQNQDDKEHQDRFDLRRLQVADQ